VDRHGALGGKVMALFQDFFGFVQHFGIFHQQRLGSNHQLFGF
jgi:hypothetical protein